MLILRLLMFLCCVFLTVHFAVAQEKDKSPKQKPFAVAPIVSSNPSMGTGLGITGSYLYKIGEGNRTSQIMGVAQYTDTDSYTVGLRNMAYWDENSKRAMTGLWFLNIENDFGGAKFTTQSYGIFHRQQWSIAKNWLAGIHGVAMWNDYTAKNELGQLFMDNNGASDNSVYGIGINVTYDTRDNFFYPYTGKIFEASTFSYLDSLGSDEDYDLLEVKYSQYWQPRGLDVIAAGFYGRYVSSGTPYSGESYLGRRNVLRGFNAGEISGTELSGIQAEYRFHHSEKLKFVAFLGYAYITGGNAERKDTEGSYYSGGVGLRYALQAKDRVHLRVDVAAGNDDNQGFYIGLQEAF